LLHVVAAVAEEGAVLRMSNVLVHPRAFESFMQISTLLRLIFFLVQKLLLEGELALLVLHLGLMPVVLNQLF
jgi:hypothetical protein